LIKSKKLSKFKRLNHGFFNRKGGISKGIYKSLNCGLGSLDNINDINKNLKIASNRMGIPSKKLILLNQVHSNKFYFIKKKFQITKNRARADALITSNKKIALGVLTADCVPILIYDNNKKIISAIHAGWKGAYNGIISKVIRFLYKKGCDPKDLTAVIGPCITVKNYEVKKRFKDKFLKKDKFSKKFFNIKKNKTYFSLNKYVYSQLKKLGIKNLELISKDTFDEKNNFFSARRSIQNKENDYGRNISVIMIN
jgi:YfiH family protein